MLIHELGHFVLSGVFAPVVQRVSQKGPHFSIDIDDCPCEECETRRGNTVIPFSTMEITMVIEGKQITQRITTEEAKAMAAKLNEFADFVKQLNEDMAKEENPLEEYA